MKIGEILNSKLLSTLLIISFIGLGVYWGVNKFQKIKTDFKISEQNVNALKDSLRISHEKNGAISYSKQMLIAKNARDLKDLNRELYDIVKGFKGEISELTKIVGKINNEPIIIDNTKLISFPNGDKGINWEHDKIYNKDNSRSLAGVTKFKFDSISNIIIPLETIITRDDITFDIIQGLRTKDGKVEMFVSSNYPNFEVSELSSVVINPNSHPVLKNFTKNKKFNLGIYTGFGATINLNNSVINFGPQIGGGVMYNF